MPTGIIIIGPSGSGKTTLGKMVSQKLGYPYFDVDDYIWKNDTEEPYSVMYSREEKISRLSSAIAPFDHFVMAGSMSSFHYAFDDKFEMMILLYAGPDIRTERVHRRAIERFGDRVLKGGDMYESHLRFLENDRRYEKDGSPNLREQRDWMNSMSCVKMELDGVNSIETNAGIIIDRWNEINRQDS
ncbi:MAG: AAA family ATPase [Ruminiclostridium sp.]|nr:AAA family ATPase [Ruminiclostridium sp.]